MNSILIARTKSFFIDIIIVILVTLVIYFILSYFGNTPSDKTMSTVRNWVSQIYFLGCLVLIPAKTLGMKINKVSFKSINGIYEIGLWAIIKFYFFQVIFLITGIVSVFFILSGQMNGILIGIVGVLLSALDLVPFILKKDYMFLHDKFSGIVIVKD